MKIAIIDDEMHCIKSLELHINSMFPKSEIVYTSTKPKEAVKALIELKIDILFLDVEMPGINGFELLEQFDNPHFEVIFTTAYSQYAIPAFKAQAINYLLKPIDEQELKEAIKNWEAKRNQEKGSKEINKLLKHLKKEGLLDSKIAVPVSDGFEFLDIKEILYCQSQNNYTYIYLENGDKVLISKTLKMVEKALERFYFLRTHQSFLINPNFMKKYIRSDGGYLVMSDKKQIPVSNSKKELITSIFEAIKRENPID
jgi:two-component system LytT family response regulator